MFANDPCTRYRFRKILESTVAAKVVDAWAIQDNYLNCPKARRAYGLKYPQST